MGVVHFDPEAGGGPYRVDVRRLGGLEHQADVERSLVVDLAIDVLALAKSEHQGLQHLLLGASDDMKGWSRAAAANEQQRAQGERRGEAELHSAGP